MRISTRGRYGLRIMTELAARHGAGPVPVDAIAETQALSREYVHQLGAGLRAAGLLRTVRGPAGGYLLTREPESITAREIVEALEGSLVPVECVADGAVCDRADRCSSRDLWQEVAEAVTGVLSGVSLQELVRRQSAREEAAAMYHI